MENERITALARVRKILILGASGFLGNHLWDHYRAIGSNVIGTRYSCSNGKFSYFDSSDLASFSQMLRAFRPEVVINASGYISGVADRALEMENSVDERSVGLNLAASCVENQVKLFLTLGSSAEYGKISQENILESAEHGVLTPYGQMKRTTTEGLSDLVSDETNIVVLRPFLVFGSGQKVPRLTPFIVQNASKIECLKSLSLGDCRDFVGVDDFVKITDRIIEKKLNDCEGSFDVFNVCSGIGVTVGDWINKIRYAIGLSKIDSFSVPPADFFVGDNSKLMHYIGPFKFTLHEDSIRTLLNDDYGNC